MEECKFNRPLKHALPDPAHDNPLFIFCGCDMRNGRAFYFSQKQVGSDLPGQQPTKTIYDMTIVQNFEITFI